MCTSRLEGNMIKWNYKRDVSPVLAQTEHLHFSFPVGELLPGKHHLRIIPRRDSHDSNDSN